MSVVVACNEPGSVRSCDDSLAGVWRLDDEHRYHITDTPKGLEMYAMFDTARPPSGDKMSVDIVYAPVVFDFRRQPGGLLGTRSQRMDRGGTICTAKTPASISDCAGATITLTLARPGPMEFASCTADPGVAQRLVLRR